MSDEETLNLHRVPDTAQASGSGNRVCIERRRLTGDHLRHDVQAYYRLVAPFFAAETAVRGDTRYWAEVARAHGGGSVLELGAGTGRVTAILAAHAATVVAVDLSPDMLRLASVRLSDQGNARLACADIRDLALRKQFDLVVAANDPFSHLIRGTDRARALAVAATHLLPAGQFVLDALWFSADDARDAARPSGRWVAHQTTAGSGSPHVVEHWQCDARGRRCTAEYAYQLDGAVVARARFRARPWSMAEVQKRFARAGLVIDRCWGGYDHEPWNPRSSSRLVIEAHRT